jgi:hypothetical protein
MADDFDFGQVFQIQDTKGLAYVWLHQDLFFTCIAIAGRQYSYVLGK